MSFQCQSLMSSTCVPLGQGEDPRWCRWPRRAAPSGRRWGLRPLAPVCCRAVHGLLWTFKCHWQFFTPPIFLDYYLPVGANVVKDGLSHAIEEDPSAHSTGKQHAEPGGIIVLRLLQHFSKIIITITIYTWLSSGPILTSLYLLR